MNRLTCFSLCLNSKLLNPVDPESSLYIMTALAHLNCTLSDGHSKKSILFHETCFLVFFSFTSIVAQCSGYVS